MRPLSWDARWFDAELTGHGGRSWTSFPPSIRDELLARALCLPCTWCKVAPNVDCALNIIVCWDRLGFCWEQQTLEYRRALLVRLKLQESGR